MEFRRICEESPGCVKLAQIEEFLEQNKGKYNLLLTDGNNIYEVYRVTTTNQAAIFHVGEHLGYISGGNMQLAKPCSDNTDARKLTKHIVRNGKSVYVSANNNVYEVRYCNIWNDTITLLVGVQVGMLVPGEYDIQHTKDHINNGSAWFNYN